MFSSFLNDLDSKTKCRERTVVTFMDQSSATPYVLVLLNLYFNYFVLNISTTSLRSVLVPTLPGKMT
ncbi:hypothetical protein PAECIP112173_01300 [Paenibacillus sp. JJ-100]|nr:hypothetical protein PAECIP112173_01300 [Paenibacillus sp. JJ-100]